MEAAAATALSLPFSSIALPPRHRCRSACLLAISLPFLPRSPVSRAAPAKPRYLRRFASRGGSGPAVSRPSPEIPNGSSMCEKLRSLRELFSRPGIGIDAYIIPSQDAHQSEFTAECFMRRAHITGFTGSAGTAVVTKDKAALWTDGRYFLQAEKQLGRDWILMRSGSLGVPTTSEWLNDVLPPGRRVGIDPFLISSDAAEELRESIAKKDNELIYLYESNFVDEIWKERPKSPMNPVRVHHVKHAGTDVLSKLSSLRSQLAEAGCTAIVISMLDEIAWLLNMRGNDIPHSPVFYSYLVVNSSSAKLFVDRKKFTDEAIIHMQNSGVELMPYNTILSELESLAAQGAKLWLDSSNLNAAVVSTFKSSCEKQILKIGNSLQSRTGQQILTVEHVHDYCNSQHNGPAAFFKTSPISLLKAVKNDVELEGMRSSHLRDAAALAEFWAWLEEEIRVNTELTEVEVADRLFDFRKKQDGFLGTSFETICGYGPNGAIVHYRPEPESCSIVSDKCLLLLDSGGQYVNGTTDVTRTVHLGEPSSWQKECFTRVLQGHIALDQAVFPENTPGFVLDVLARSPLWKIGLDYRHGTGHGVGAALNVHEGPQSISFRYGNMTSLRSGMIISNEPGYYEDHSFGIRIENLLSVKDVKLQNSFGGIRYLCFEKLTFVPIQKKLIDLSLLSSMEIKWIDDYHSQVWEKVSPLVVGSAREWLHDNTRPLHES